MEKVNGWREGDIHTAHPVRSCPGVNSCYTGVLRAGLDRVTVPVFVSKALEREVRTVRTVGLGSCE